MMKRFAIALVLIVLAAGGYYLFLMSRMPTVFTRHDAPTVEEKALLFAGDIMLGRNVERLANAERNPLRSFEKVRDFLKEHIVIANLEGPIPNVHTPTPMNGMSFSFPANAPQVLKDAGVIAVSLANNHMFDKGSEGYEDTKYALDKAGITHFGGYAPTYDYFETTLGDRKVIVYGLATISSEWDEHKAEEVTYKLRASHGDAYLIAFMHWGDEYVTQHKYQRALAHKLVYLGVDAIIGAHPHVVQGVEVYDGTPIFYSLGNFVFDQYWRKDLENGLFVQLSEKGNSYAYELIPIHSSRSVPYVATSTKRDEILHAIAVQSDESIRMDILRGELRFERQK